MMAGSGKTHSVARLYQTAKELNQKSAGDVGNVDAPTGESTGTSHNGPAQPKMTSQKSPGKTFKS